MTLAHSTVARRVAPALLALGLALGVGVSAPTAQATDSASSPYGATCAKERRDYRNASGAEAVARERVAQTRSAYVSARNRYRDSPTAANRRRMQAAQADYNDAVNDHQRAAALKAQAKQRLDRCTG